MLMRTNLDRFWQAFSEDGGRYWRTIQPSPFDASSSPGHLARLRSGRLVLIWNRLNPEGGIAPKGGPGVAAECPASWYRGAFSIAFSEDQAKTWTKPMLLAREKNGLSYPYVFERRPGELWLFAGFGGPLRVRANEEELCREVKRNARSESGDKSK
jgi:predicted neuraminidase